MVILSEILLYFSCSILLGSLILNVVPETKRPKLNMPKSILLVVIVGIASFSFAPVLSVILYFYEEVGFWVTFQSVVLTFEIGQAWIITCLIAFVLFFVILLSNLESNKQLSYLPLLLTFILILALGWTSHAASLTPLYGFISHTAHFLAVSLWVGVLLVVSWWSSDSSNWRSFLSWFHPVAIICLVITIIAGLGLMQIVRGFDNYTTTWLIPYGQALLIKHVLIIPLITFAFTNGFLMKRRLKDNLDFNPIPWARTESVIILLIFAATAVLGQQSPPHTITPALLQAEYSKLFAFFHQGSFDPLMPVVIGVNGVSVILLLSALGFLFLTIFCFIRKKSPLWSLCMSFLFVITSYLGIIYSVQ